MAEDRIKMGQKQTKPNDDGKWCRGAIKCDLREKLLDFQKKLRPKLQRKIVERYTSGFVANAPIGHDFGLYAAFEYYLCTCSTKHRRISAPRCSSAFRPVSLLCCNLAYGGRYKIMLSHEL